MNRPEFESNDQLDKEVLRLIQTMAIPTHRTFDVLVRKLQESFRVDFRKVDRSLQRLRKKGKIRFSRTSRSWEACAQ